MMFVQSFARLNVFFNKKLRKNQTNYFVHQKGSENVSGSLLKEAVISSPVMTLSGNEAYYTHDSDVFDNQIGCVPFQKQNDRSKRPVGYWLRTLNDKERMLSTTHRDYRAVIWAIKLPRPFLREPFLTIQHDHGAHKWILNMAETTGKLPRWWLRLLEFETDMVHRGGIRYQTADRQSRLITNREGHTPLEDEIHALTVIPRFLVVAPSMI